MADNIKIDLLINAAESAKTIQETKKALRDLKTEAMNLTEGTAAFTKVATAAGQLQDKIGDLSATTKYLGDDLRNIKAISGIGQGIAAGFAIATGAAALFGDENKALQASMVKLQAIMAVMQGMEQIGAVLQKESAAMLGIKNAVTKTAIFLTSEQAVAEAAEAVAAGTATVAQRALNAAMNANPIGILITLILAGVAALTLWNSKSDAAAKAEKEANDEKKKNIALLKAQQEEQNKHSDYVSKEATGYFLLTEQLKKTNPGSAERLRLIKEINGTYGTTLKNLKDEKEFQDQVGASVDNYIFFLEKKYALQANEGNIQKNLKAQFDAQERINKVKAEFNALEKVAISQGSTYMGVMPAELQDQIDMENQTIKTLKTRLKSYAVYEGELQDVIEKSNLKTVDNAEKTNKSIVKSNDDKNKAIEEANIKALERQAKLKELEAKGITDYAELTANLMEDGYDKQLALLEVNKNKEIEQSKETSKEMLDLLKQAEIDKLTLSNKYITDNKKAGYQAQQDFIEKTAQSNQLLQDELKREAGAKLIIEADYLEKSARLKDNDYLKNVEEGAAKEQSILNEKYKNNEISGQAYLLKTQKLADDLKFIQDEFSKNSAATSVAFLSVDTPIVEEGVFNLLEKTTEEHVVVMKNLGLQSAEDLIKIDTEKNKKLAENQVKANEEAYVEFDKDEQKKIALKQKLNDELIQLEMAFQAATLSIFNNQMDVRAKANQKAYDEKIALIDAEENAYKNAQENRTTLQQAQYDTELGFAEERKNAERVRQLEEDKIKKKQFNAQKINDAATVAINTGVAVSKTIAELGGVGALTPPGIALIAAMIAGGIIQETSILSKKYIPTYATGGLVTGPGTGTSDSIDARLSNGESVINAKSTSMFAPMLSAINQAGGGVAIPHTKNSIFNPSIPTENQVMDIQPLIDAINNKSNEVYVKEVSVTNSQNRADKLKRRTSF